MSAFTVTHVKKSATAAPAQVATAADLMKTLRHKKLNSPKNSPIDRRLSSTVASRLLAPRADLDLSIQLQAVEAEKQQALDRFVAEYKSCTSQQNVHDEAIAAKMLVVESARFQKVNKSAVLEHTLRPTLAEETGGLKPGCHVSTIKLMLSDVDVIMRNHRNEDNGYSAVKKSLGRIPLWGLPAAAGSFI